MPSQLVDSAIEKEFSARARQDLALVQAALAGQPRAHEALLEHYRKPVFNLVLKIVPAVADAEDLTMEAFARAFRHLSTYTATFAFSTWLFRIATNASIDFLRRKRVATSSLSPAGPSGAHEEESPLVHEAPDRDPDPLEVCIQQQRREWVHQVVGRLPLKYVAPVRLRYFEERSYEEIATELQLPLGTVKAFLSRARELLLPLLKDSPHAR